ncbi:hypothetical protein [Arthrobacter methylotrophus]|uniref:Transposase n=1 Tax=Arthrobacter methylotrophus TaxID=121291 RepID=A0ABV5UTU3_9MICC
MQNDQALLAIVDGIDRRDSKIVDLEAENAQLRAALQAATAQGAPAQGKQPTVGKQTAGSQPHASPFDSDGQDPRSLV